MSTERRHSFRCKNDAETPRVEGVLHSRRGDVIVQVQNRSSGGFGVLLPAGGNSHVKDDEEIAFSLGGGSSLVRVAHQSATPEGMIIGLEILRELPSHLSKSYGKRNNVEGGSGKVFRFVMVTACLALIALNIPWGYFFSAVKQGEIPEQIAKEVRTGSERIFGAQDRDARESRLASTYFQIDQLKSHRAISRLNLSMAQQRDISRIVQQTTNSMEAIFKSREAMGDSEWTELGLQLLQSSAKRIEATLTDKQKADWAAFSNDNRGVVSNPFAD